MTLALLLAALAAVATARRAAVPGRAGSALARAPSARRASLSCGEELSPLHTTVEWLPPLGSGVSAEEGALPAEGTLTLPVFPLGSTCYLPFSSHGLNIFEPRYRAMYNDILFNGSRRFVVAMVDSLTGRLAKTGVVFYLDELKGARRRAAAPRAVRPGGAT